jgi:hypothetical protein
MNGGAPSRTKIVAQTVTLRGQTDSLSYIKGETLDYG